VGLILIVGMLILDVDYAVFVGIVIAFLDMLPFLGTGTVLFPWAVLKVCVQDYRMAVGLLILYAITQVVRQIIQPKLIGDSIGLSPLPTLVFIYIGYQIGGIFGMLIAIPFGMIVIELYRKGIFDGVLKDLREIVEDINRFRKAPGSIEEEREPDGSEKESP
jgi:predicted PurR-regulated permease PerM